MDESIYEKLTRYCSYQERCEQDVFKKMKSLKVEEEQLLYLARLKEEKCLDEDRYAKAFVNGHIRKKWGKAKIKMALQRKRIAMETIKKHLENVEDENYEERILKAAQIKWGRLKDENVFDKKRKLFAFLMSKGYESALIKKAIAQLSTAK